MLVNSAPTDNAMITIFVEVSKIVSVSVVPAAPPVTYLLLLLGSWARWCRRGSCGLLPAPALGPGLHGLRWLLAAAALDTASWATELLSHAGHPPLDFDSGVLIKQTRPVSPRLARTAHWALVCRPPGPYPYTRSCSRGWTHGTEMVPEVETKVRMYRQRQEQDPAPFFLIVRANIEPGVARRGTRGRGGGLSVANCHRNKPTNSRSYESLLLQYNTSIY